MEETTFAADPMRLMIAAAVGIVVLLVLIIKFKLHPVLSMMISAIIIFLPQAVQGYLFSPSLQQIPRTCLPGAAC